MSPYPHPYTPPTREQLIAELGKARAEHAREHDVELHRAAWSNDVAELVHDRPIVEAAEALVAHWSSRITHGVDREQEDLICALAVAVHAKGCEPA